MKPHKFLRHHKILRPTIVTNHQPLFSALFSSAPQTPETLPPIDPTNPHIVTRQHLLDLVASSQWHLIKHLSPNLSPSLTSQTLITLRESPHLVLQFINHVDSHHIDLKTLRLATTIIAQIPSPKPALSLLKSAAVNGGPGPIREVFDELWSAKEELGFESSPVFDFLIRACLEAKKANEGFECFYMMKEKGVVPKIETCNDMLSFFSSWDMLETAWVLYAEMFRLKIMSNSCTFNIMIDVLCKQGKLKKAKEFIEHMDFLGVKPDTVTYNTLIHGYCSKGRIEAARTILDTMERKGFKPDSFTYSSLITGLCKGKRLDEATKVFEKMRDIGLAPSAVTYNELIKGYCNEGDLDKAFGCRDEMAGKGMSLTVSTYNALIHTLFLKDRSSEEADGLVNEMRGKGLTPDETTLNVLINGACRLGDEKRAFGLRDEMESRGIAPTRVTYAPLIYLMSKQRKMREAEKLLEMMMVMGKKVSPDRVIFNVLIEGHCCNNNGMARAFKLVEKMEEMGISPDEVTFNALMKGRCREGKLEAARELLEEMKRRGIKPDRVSYSTLIGGYSKKSDGKDSLGVRDEISEFGFDPTLLTYSALVEGLLQKPG